MADELDHRNDERLVHQRSENAVDAFKDPPEGGRGATTAQVQPQQPVDPIDGWPIPPEAKAWIKAHKEVVEDEAVNAQVQQHHHAMLDEGYQAYSPAYFRSMKERLGFREPLLLRTMQSNRSRALWPF
jgi:hypothetical protein